MAICVLLNLAALDLRRAEHRGVSTWTQHESLESDKLIGPGEPQGDIEWRAMTSAGWWSSTRLPRQKAKAAG